MLRPDLNVWLILHRISDYLVYIALTSFLLVLGRNTNEFCSELFNTFTNQGSRYKFQNATLRARRFNLLATLFLPPKFSLTASTSKQLAVRAFLFSSSDIWNAGTGPEFSWHGKVTQPRGTKRSQQEISQTWDWPVPWTSSARSRAYVVRPHFKREESNLWETTDWNSKPLVVGWTNASEINIGQQVGDITTYRWTNNRSSTSSGTESPEVELLQGLRHFLSLSPRPGVYSPFSCCSPSVAPAVPLSQSDFYFSSLVCLVSKIWWINKKF